MRDVQRLNYLYQNFVISQEMPESRLAELTLEDLTFIHASCEAAKKDEKNKGIHYPIRQQIIYWEAVKALKAAETVYVAQTRTPAYPYIDPKGNCWVFSDLDIAKGVCADLMKKQQMELGLRPVENKMIRPMLAQMFFMGVDNIVIDNGMHPIVMKRTDIFPEQKQENTSKDFSNGELQRAMIQFYQYVSFTSSLRKASEQEGIAEEEKANLQDRLKKAQESLRLLEARMIYRILEAKYLVPMIIVQDGQNLAPGQKAEAGKAVSRKIANVKDSNGVNWIPAFSDWTEFSRIYPTKEWGANIVTYEELVKLSKEVNANRVIINPKGCAFRIDDRNVAAIEAFAKKKAELEAKKKTN